MVSRVEASRLTPRAVGPVDDFLRSVASELDRGVLPARVFNDPEIHALELERVFARGWVFLGHETEIPAPGDYALRFIGEDQFILVRDEAGIIRVLLNNCAHRGSLVCRAERGNTSHFRCPYHAWVYKNSGEWVGAPLKRRAYQALDAKQWGLQAAPHVESSVANNLSTNWAGVIEVGYAAVKRGRRTNSSMNDCLLVSSFCCQPLCSTTIPLLIFCASGVNSRNDSGTGALPRSP